LRDSAGVGMKTDSTGFPVKQGLYDPAYEKDACGVGFVVSIDGISSHQVSFDCFLGQLACLNLQYSVDLVYKSTNKQPIMCVFI